VHYFRAQEYFLGLFLANIWSNSHELKIILNGIFFAKSTGKKLPIESYKIKVMNNKL
jgi:hypothetical protein